MPESLCFSSPALFGKTIDELTSIALKLKLPAYAGKQLCEWLYKKEISGIEEMTNLSKKARSLLAEVYTMEIIEPLGESARQRLASNHHGCRQRSRAALTEPRCRELANGVHAARHPARTNRSPRSMSS